MPQQQTSAVGVSVFRELDGNECAAVFAHDLEQAIINMLATDEFKEKAMEWFTKTGRFGSGACYPVVMAQAKLLVKVYASVESARSKEKLPAPFILESPEIQTGEMLTEVPHKADCQTPGACECEARSATEMVTEAEIAIQRVIGLSPADATDRVRLEVGLSPLVPTRTESGHVVNAPGKHAQRQADYDARGEKQSETKRLQRGQLLAAAKARVAANRAAREAAQQTEAERLRGAEENEARIQES